MNERYRLLEQLKHYTETGLYPMHMPGHKRRVAPAPELPFGWDMTEVEGVDDLHEAEGILRQAMDRTARLHGAAQTWYLVNGSTCGLLAGIRALAPAGSRIIAARNCHKAVYHAMELGGLEPRWLLPPVIEPFGVYGSVTPEMVERALQETPDAACVLLTSPTYEGVISDIAAIANLCHQAGVPLLVDEAHGAHLGLAEGWPRSAVQLGADLVVQSAHKTLPSLTQTAYLHLGKHSLVDPAEVERQLDIFETSSPSYPLLVSLDGCTGLLAADGAELFGDWSESLHRFDEKIGTLEKLRVLCHGADRMESHSEIFAFDPGKLAICTAGTAETGTSLAARLRKEYGFETEMACGRICLAMTSLCDAPTAVDRLAETLVELDREILASDRQEKLLLPAPGPLCCTIAQAVLRPAREIPLAEAEGEVSGEYIWAYPPGVPLSAPGETITREFLDAASALSESGTLLRHTCCKKPGYVQVLT